MLSATAGYNLTTIYYIRCSKGVRKATSKSYKLRRTIITCRVMEHFLCFNMTFVDMATHLFPLTNQKVNLSLT